MSRRLKVLRGVYGRHHRYRVLRGVTMTVSLALLAAIPLAGLARLDLFTGAHRFGGAAAHWLYGAVGIGVAFAGFYVVTFLINLLAGRLYCGWGCPVGQMNRLADSFEAARRGIGRWRRGAGLFSFVSVFCLVLCLWVASPRAFLPGASIVGAGLLLSVSIVAALVWALRFRWRFCEAFCPIGLYYSVVQIKRPVGIHYDANRCLDEAACVHACPVALDPRALGTSKNEIGGFAMDGFPMHHHCLRCGACVEACELVTHKQEAPALSFRRLSADESGHR